MSLTLCEQLALIRLARKNRALLADNPHPDAESALRLIYQAMLDSKQLLQKAADRQLRLFVVQMRRLGLPRLTESEPYLMGELARFRLELLQKLELVFEQVERHMPRKSADIDLMPQVEDMIAQQQLRTAQRLEQSLNEKRQRSNGVHYYIWRTQGDEHVRPTHAALDGELCRWGVGLSPGEEDGCRCDAEPTGPIDDPPIEPVYPELLLYPLLRLERAAAVILKRTTDKLKQFAKPTEKPQKPEPTPGLKKPEGIPKDWKQKPTKNGMGNVYKDPNNPGNYVKVQKGNPNSSQPGQRYDNVRIQKDGISYDKHGNKVLQQSQDSHIPIEDFKFPKELFK